ncbi:MAG: hypothetical protein IAI48_16685 [Candidatus Eremiobacteraeota bacterium]|nr:hypothetical protein [Candidatus Eremiobacteraeota bacterium]
MRASGTAYLDRRVVFAADVQDDRLIVAGPFRYVRNPLYLGNLFLALGVAALAPPAGFAIIMLGNLMLVAALAREETIHMRRRYGAAFDAFRSAVPSFVPRLTPAQGLETASVVPAWRSALLGEAFCLTIGLAIVPLALYGDAGQPAFWTIFCATFVVFGTAGWLAGRARANA